MKSEARSIQKKKRASAIREQSQPASTTCLSNTRLVGVIYILIDSITRLTYFNSLYAPDRSILVHCKVQESRPKQSNVSSSVCQSGSNSELQVWSFNLSFNIASLTHPTSNISPTRQKLETCNCCNRNWLNWPEWVKTQRDIQSAQGILTSTSAFS